MPCMRSKRFWMQNNFKPVSLEKAYEKLSRDLNAAEKRMDESSKMEKKSLPEKNTFWSKLLDICNRYF